MPRYVDLNNPKLIHMGRDKFGDGIYHIIGVPLPPDLPTAEVVEVVRCKGCKYGHRLTDVNGYNYRTCNYPWGHGMMVEEYGFCKWGERRTDDEE